MPVDAVAFITPETAPRTVVLLLDNVAVGPELAIRVRETARAFVQQLGERDRVSVGPVEGPQIDGTGEPARLLQAIEKYHPQGFPLRIEDAGEHVLRLLTATAQQMIEIPGRKAIVAIGAAWLFDTPLPPPGLRDLRDVWLTAMRSMAAANVSLYVIDPVGIRPMRGFSLCRGRRIRQRDRRLRLPQYQRSRSGRPAHRRRERHLLFAEDGQSAGSALGRSAQGRSQDAAQERHGQGAARNPGE